VEILAIAWSLLIIRDMMLRGFRTYKEISELLRENRDDIFAARV